MSNLICNNNIKIPLACRSQKNKMNFKTLKNNTIKSLQEVEFFLNDFNRFSNYIKLYKILK